MTETRALHPVTGLTAAEMIEKIRDKGGRVYRMQIPPQVYVLTMSQSLAARLLQLGARPHPGTGTDDGSYLRSVRGKREWDLYVHSIPVAGEQTWWEAAA